MNTMNTMKHLGMYNHRTQKAVYDGTERFCRFQCYEKDLLGNRPPTGEVYLQDARTGIVNTVKIADYPEDQLTEAMPKEGKHWFNPKRGVAGEWNEVFYHVWRKGEEERIILPWNGEKRGLYLARVATELAPETLIHPIVGHIYRGKTPKRVTRFGPDEIDDKQILHVGPFTVQYDSSTVRMGKHYPKMDRYAFYNWVGSDVTELYKATVPDGEWAKWSDRNATIQ